MCYIGQRVKNLNRKNKNSLWSFHHTCGQQPKGKTINFLHSQPPRSYFLNEVNSIIIFQPGPCHIQECIRIKNIGISYSLITVRFLILWTQNVDEKN